MKISSKKKVREIVAKSFMWMAMFIVFGLVISVIWTVFSKGVKAMSWDMVSKLPGGGFYIGKEGGFLNAIVGSLYIVGASTALGLIVSIPVVFFLNVYLQRDSKLAYAARMAFDVLFGVPSIVYGAFGFTIMIYFGLRTSLLGGIIVITLLIIPIFIRTMDEATRNFPRDILDASFALGATRWETLKVVLRQIAPGIATATLLSVGRAIGDAASVMSTAGPLPRCPSPFSSNSKVLSPKWLTAPTPPLSSSPSLFSSSASPAVSSPIDSRKTKCELVISD